jgi:hypothetical protein
MTDTDQPAEAAGKDQPSKTGKDKNVEFERLRKSDLKSVPVFAQALDNQWLPRSLLREALKKGGVTPSIERKLTKLVRAEYMRALLNSEQVIINRPYLYNNPAISQDYSKRNSPEYQAFKTLLEDETIIVLLLTEESPTDKPIFDLQEQASARWVQLCQEVRIHCIRLSWDSKENERLISQKLHRRFQQFVVDAAAGDIDIYLQDLGLDQGEKDSLRKRLVQMGQSGLELHIQGKQITRNILYKKFVMAGNNPAERRYDNTKPFAGEIKQLIDLRHNSNLADALSGYLITPADSLPRTALQEWEERKGQLSTITAKELLSYLQRTAFNLAGRTLNVPSMDLLQLPDVRAIRATEEWILYMQNLQTLLNHPEQFADGLAAGVYQSYAVLAKRITSQINQQPGKSSLLTSWSPTVELVFDIAGAVLSYRLTDQGPQWRLQGKMAELIAHDTAPVVGKFVIRDPAEEHPQQDLSIGIDFLHFQIPDVQEQWKEIEMEVRRLPGFQEITEEPEDSTISYKEPLE